MKAVPLDISPERESIIRDILRKFVSGFDVWAFGSRTRGTAKKYSDLDLSVITDKPLDLVISAALNVEFSESDLPYKVDIVDWSNTNDSFRRIIEGDKAVIQHGSH